MLPYNITLEERLPYLRCYLTGGVLDVLEKRQHQLTGLPQYLMRKLTRGSENEKRCYLTMLPQKRCYLTLKRRYLTGGVLDVLEDAARVALDRGEEAAPGTRSWGYCRRGLRRSNLVTP